jgi:hypothetical protein
MWGCVAECPLVSDGKGGGGGVSVGGGGDPDVHPSSFPIRSGLDSTAYLP